MTDKLQTQPTAPAPTNCTATCNWCGAVSIYHCGHPRCLLPIYRLQFTEPTSVK